MNVKCVFALVIIFYCKIIVGEFDPQENGFKIEKSDDTYEPTWTSLDKRPLPSWYDKAKVGIFIHWGVYAVPTMGTEWFWTNWKNEHVPAYVKYMENNFAPGFTYQEFAKEFTAEHFDPVEWAGIFNSSGARYVVLVSKHHDGYAMWPSKYSFSWNSVDIGPHRNVIKELSEAIREKTSIKFGLYHSLFEWFNPLYLADKQSNFTEQDFVTKKILPEIVELVNTYHPEILWSDGEWEAEASYWNSTEFIAWLYNESPVRKTVVTNDRWGRGTLCKHGDFYTCQDRYNPGVLQSHKWENAMTLDKLSWGNRATAKIEDFYTSEELIKELVSTVSCGGNILINVGPTKSGIIEPIFVERLVDMGDWLQVNGEAIYETVPWKHQNDSKTEDVWYTTKSTLEDKYEVIYAIVLKYPYETDGITLQSMAGNFNNNTRVSMLGIPDRPLNWYGSHESMYVTFPAKALIDKLKLKFAWTLKIEVPKKNL